MPVGDFEKARNLKRPLGVMILGGLNFFVLGIASFVFFFGVHQRISSSGAESFLGELGKTFPQIQVTPPQLKIAIVLQIAIALIFSISGLGILFKREWARKTTLYFSFFMVTLAFVGVLFNFSLIKQAVLQIIYPGTLILYFTNKKVEKYFTLSGEEAEQGENQ